MAILLRNKLTNSDDYKTVDVALTSVTYNPTNNQTTVNVLSSDENHDAVNIGDYMIPMRGATSASPGFNSFDIVDPREDLKIVNKAVAGSGARSLTLFGDQRKFFPGNGSPSNLGNTIDDATKHGSPEGYYRSTGYFVSSIKRGRKYRITKLGATNWSAFGSLYNSTDTATDGRTLATVGTTFVARSSGSAAGESAESPNLKGNFSLYRGGIGESDSPYIISGLTNFATTGVNGTYYKKSKYFYENENNVAIQLRGASDLGGGLVGRWTIWNPDTRKVYFEDSETISNLTNRRFDSPTLGSVFRPSVGSGTNNGNTPSIDWIDRTVSVSSNDQYTTGVDTDAGQVIEVAHVSSSIGINRPLTNNDVDTNFISLETKKLASDGSQPLDGNLTIKGSGKIETTLDVTSQITLGGATPYSSNTGLTLGTKDLEVNNIRLTGIINDDALFRKYGISGFPHSFLGDYNTKNVGIEPCTILYFTSVTPFTTGNTIVAKGNSKTGRVRRVNTEYGYIMVSNTNSTGNWVVGDSINGLPSAGSIVRVLNPADYIIGGQNLRIFGMNQSDTPLQATFSLSTLADAQQPPKPAAPTAVAKFTSSGNILYTYRMAKMDSDTGKISELSDASNSIFGPELADWDKTNYIQLTGITRDNNRQRILIYRQKAGESNYFLTNVLDANEVNGTSAIVVNDYGTYDKAPWGTLDDVANNYHFVASDEVTYVPITNTNATSISGDTNSGVRSYVGFVGNYKKYASGYLDTKVDSQGIQTNTSSSPAFFRISETTFSDSPNLQLRWPKATGTGLSDRYNSPMHVHTTGTAYGKENEIEFFIDNSRIVDSPKSGFTGGIQKLILDSAADGKRTIRMPGGTFYSRMITIPSNFKFGGQSDRNTTIKLLPWLNDSQNTRTPFGGFTRPVNNYDDQGTGGTRRRKQFIEFFNEFTTGEIGNGVSSDATVQRFANLTATGTIEDGGAAQLASSDGIFAGVYAGRKSYARVLLDLDAKTNVEVDSIKFDGNRNSNSVVELDTSFKSNFLVTSQKASNISYKNMTISDTTLSGLFGEDMTEVVIEGSTIKNGGLRLDESQAATGIFAPGSSKLRLTSNLIENFSNSNDLTSNSNSTLTGNIVRDTGSGILAYATSNFVHHGNLILGPSNEFIPVVDTLNSEYDQFNINLINESGASGNTFTSDIITFLRDDSPLNMAPINTTTKYPGIAITSSIRTLVQKGTQTYFLPKTYNNVGFDYTFGAPADTSGYIITNNLPVTSTTDPSLTSGNIQMKINQTGINELADNANFGKLASNYSPLTGRPAGESLVGLVFDVTGEEYLYLGANDQPINWDAISINKDNLQETITLRIDSNYSSLFAIGDKVIFESGSLPTGQLGNCDNIGLATKTATDANGNPIYIGLPIKAKKVEPLKTTLTLDISDSALGSDGSAARAGIQAISETELDSLEGVGATAKAGAKVGIRNSFSIAKGRIII